MLDYYCTRCRLPKHDHSSRCPLPAATHAPLDTLISQARQLTESTVVAQRLGWGIGLERDSTLDAQSGTLTLHFSDRAPLVLPAQVIAAYHPHRRQLLWACDLELPSSVTQVSRSLRRHAVRRGWAPLRASMLQCSATGAQELTGVAMLLALASGVHEVALTPQLSVFVIYTLHGARPAAAQPRADHGVRWVA